MLLRHSRYAVLAIVTVAAAITPPTDPFNLMLVAGPLCALFFVGIGVGFLVTLRCVGRTVSKSAPIGIGIECLAAAGIGGARVLKPNSASTLAARIIRHLRHDRE